MASPISEISLISGDLFGQTAAPHAEVAAKANPAGPKPAMIRPEGDSVTLSINAKAKKMKESGESDAEIANRLNLDVKTVERCLGIVPASAAEQAYRMKQEGDSINRIADQLGVDIETVKSFLGIVPVPAAIQAKQLEQQGESIMEIASRLGVDVRTVQRYLGPQLPPNWQEE